MKTEYRYSKKNVRDMQQLATSAKLQHVNQLNSDMSTFLCQPIKLMLTVVVGEEAQIEIHLFMTTFQLSQCVCCVSPIHVCACMCVFVDYNHNYYTTHNNLCTTHLLPTKFTLSDSATFRPYMVIVQAINKLSAHKNPILVNDSCEDSSRLD